MVNDNCNVVGWSRNTSLWLLMLTRATEMFYCGDTLVMRCPWFSSQQITITCYVINKVNAHARSAYIDCCLAMSQLQMLWADGPRSKWSQYKVNVVWWIMLIKSENQARTINQDVTTLWHVFNLISQSPIYCRLKLCFVWVWTLQLSSKLLGHCTMLNPPLLLICF